MKAISEAARTSRASAPIARPSAAKASAATATAASQSGKRSQLRSMNSPRPASISRQTALEQTAARPAFSASRPVRDTSPRTSLAKAFSSRSPASIPAASSRVMNMSVTAAASATANALSDVLPPSSARASTLIGSPTTPSTSSEKARFSRASSAKEMTSSSCSRSGEPGASSLRASVRMRSARASPRTSKSCPRKLYSPPSEIRLSRSSASSAIRLVSAALARWTWASMVFSTNSFFAGSSAL